MSKEEFKKYIESIGFKYDSYSYLYKNYQIDLYNNYYNFYNGLNWWWYKDYDDLTDLETIFKKELRSIKLKQLLSL